MSDIIKQVAAELGLQPDDSPTSEPQVDVAANHDVTVAYPDRFLRFVVTSISKQKRRYDAFVTVLFKPVPDRPARRLIADTHVDLSSTNSKAGVVRSLKNLRQEEWATMIEEVASAVQDNWQPGEAAVRLEDVPNPGAIEYLVQSLLQVDEHTVIFGPGGSGKSITVLAIGLSVATLKVFVPTLEPQAQGPVLYLDWERSASPHRLRYTQLLAGLGISGTRDFHYRRMVGSLTDSAEEIKHYCAEHGIVLCIADSVGMAVAGEISDEPAVMGYFNAARYIGGTWLSIAHVPKEEAHGKPIGSQYWYTQPQGGTYEIQGETPEGSSILSLTMIHQKTNDERNKTLGWNVQFGNDEVRYTNADPLDTTTDLSKIPLIVRVKRAFSEDSTPRSAKAIGEEIGSSENSVGNLFRNTPDTFVILGKGKPKLWGLLTDRLPPVETSGYTSGLEVSTYPPLKGEGSVDTIPQYEIENEKTPWWIE